MKINWFKITIGEIIRRIALIDQSSADIYYVTYLLRYLKIGIRCLDCNNDYCDCYYCNNCKKINCICDYNFELYELRYLKSFDKISKLIVKILSRDLIDILISNKLESFQFKRSLREAYENQLV